MKSSTFKSIIITLLLLLTKLSNAQSGSVVTLGRYWGGNSKFFQVVLTILSLLFVQNIIAQTVTNLNDSGTGSLRQSIVDAEANAGADTISFTSGLLGTITLASDLPNITENLTIIGPGIGLVLSGNNSWKMFNVTNNAQLTISQMTFSYCAQNIADNTGSVFNVGSGSKIYADNIRLTNNAWLIAHTFHNISDTSGTVLSISDSEVSNNITTNTSWAQDNLFSCRHGSTPNYPIIESDEKNRLLFENVTFLNNNTPKLIYSTRFLKINNCTFTGNKQVFLNYSANRHIVTNSTFTSNTPDPDPYFGVASLFHTSNWYTQMWSNWHIDPTWGTNFNLYDNNSFSNNGGDILISYNSNWSASGGADYLSNYDLNGGKTFTTISNNTGTHQAALTFISSSGSGVIYLNNTLTAPGINSAPTGVSLSPSSVNENVSIGTTVGSLSTTDSDSGDSHTYSLVTGSGDTDNGSFSISGANLLTGTALDYETKNSYSIRVQTSDGTATYAKTFTITVADVFEDADGDGIPDQTDNCQSSANPNQADADADGIGDVCDSDIDGDGFANSSDNCPSTVNLDQADFDADGSGDLCDLDDDNDGVLDTDDAFPLDETETVDTDNDGIGNNADLDDDNDGVLDTDDAFPLDETETIDTDNDGIGNNADQDDDNDTYLDSNDDFPLDSSEWIDTDGDGLGNNEDLNDDDDYCLDEDDNFPLDSSLCIDTDGDGIDNSFDIDIDGDGVWNDQDDFPLDASESKDTDGDGIGDNTDPDINNDGFPEGQLFISGALTPQSGGLESTWKIINLEMYPYSIVQVFSPDGSLVFKDINYKNDWKGAHYKTGKALPTGPYLYQIYIGEKEEPLTGWIYIFN